jgi:hypothetical protein
MSHTAPPSKPTGAAATWALVALVIAIAAGGLWWVRHQDEPAAGDDAGDVSSAAPGDGGEDPGRGNGGNGGKDDKHGDGDGKDGGPGDGSDGDPGLGADAEDIAAQDFPDDPRVVVISVDGLGSLWVSKQTTPTIADLLGQGAGTLDARTEYEKTVTLPNHTGMVTGDRIAAARGGHGVTWNHTSTQSVVPGTSSVFTTLTDAGGSSSVYVGKEKFEMWGRAWPGAIEQLEIKEDQTALVGDAIADLRADDDDLVFLHLAGPDSAGHASGWGSTAYLGAVKQADADIDRVVSAIVADPELAEEVVVIVTADHGGVPGTTAHIDPQRSENYTIPFVVWGPGVARADLYLLNPDYRDPGDGRPGYGGPQPVRNGDVANLVTSLLGLDPVAGSLFDRGQDLDVE